MLNLKFQARDYQVKAQQDIYSAWHRHNRVLLQLPTGGGKTVLFGMITSDYIQSGHRVLILAHREELVLQAADKVGAITGTAVGIIKSGIEPNYDAPIQVASVQTLIRRLGQIDPKAFGLVVIDESHHATAKTYRKILEYFASAQHLGVTATPCRRDGSGFEDLFDVLVTGPTVAELIASGHLSQFSLYADANPMSTKGARKNAGDYRASDIAAVNDVVELSGNLISSYLTHCPGKRCVVFAVNCDHSRAIVERYSAAGIPAEHLDGESTIDYRRAALERFKRGETLVLSNVGLFTEGFDLPSLDAVQVARPTASLSLWLQMLGRALRTAEGKDRAILLDHTKNWAIHGLPTRQRLWSLEGVKRPKSDDNRVLQRNEKGLILEELVLDIIESKATLEAIESNPLDEWQEIWNKLIKTQKAKGYHAKWIFYQLQKIKPPLEIWQQCADYLQYKPGWAWHQWKGSQDVAA